MCQHSGALEWKWNRQLTRPIFPAGTKKKQSGDETIECVSLQVTPKIHCELPGWLNLSGIFFVRYKSDVFSPVSGWLCSIHSPGWAGAKLSTGVSTSPPCCQIDGCIDLITGMLLWFANSRFLIFMQTKTFVFRLLLIAAASFRQRENGAYIDLCMIGSSMRVTTS